MKDSDDAVTKAERVAEDESDGDRELPNWMLAAAREHENASPERTNRRDAPPARNNENQPANLARADLRRQPCVYGGRCYRRNPAHRAELSHPGDSDYSPEQETDEHDRPECQYGTACYRQNPKHKKEFKHTRPPANDPQTATRREHPSKPPAKRRRKADEDEYEPPSENEYDLNDPFIDDSEQDGEDEESPDDDDDEDYVPENNVDPDLLNEEEWSATPGDAPEVLELLKEARDYLRNKKMQK